MNDLPFRTCLNFGRSFFRMFDGLEYQFAGMCTYTLAENILEGWHVEMTVKNCDYWTTCRKVGLFSFCHESLLFKSVSLSIVVLLKKKRKKERRDGWVMNPSDALYQTHHY